MERYEIVLERAKRDLKLADHMINVTYKMVGDPKMLLSVMTRLKSGLDGTMEAMLLYDRLYKRIPPFTENFEMMHQIFRQRCLRRYNLDSSYVDLIAEVHHILKERKESPVEFSRKDKFVICTEDYRMKVLSIDNIKNYINKARMFQIEAERTVSRNGRSDT